MSQREARSREQPGVKLPSLADYLIRYDLATMIRIARTDYNEVRSGAPRLLEQKDIAARFRAGRGGKKAGS